MVRQNAAITLNIWSHQNNDMLDWIEMWTVFYFPPECIEKTSQVSKWTKRSRSCSIDYIWFYVSSNKQQMTIQCLFSLLQCTTTPVNGKWLIKCDLIWDVSDVAKTQSLCFVLFRDCPLYKCQQVSCSVCTQLSETLSSWWSVINVWCCSGLQVCCGTVLERSGSKHNRTL